MQYPKLRRRGQRSNKRRFPPEGRNAGNTFEKNGGVRTHDPAIPRPRRPQTEHDAAAGMEPGSAPNFGSHDADEDVPAILRNIRPSTD